MEEDRGVTHTVMIVLHAAAGVVCFAAGVWSLPVAHAGSWRFRVYAGSLAGMLVFLGAAIGLVWSSLTTGTRWIYLGLSVLGLYMAWRAVRAGLRLRHRNPGWRPRYLDDVGFTLIALFEGFVIVAAIDLGAPGWLVAVVAVAGLVAGHFSLRRVKARLTRVALPPTGASAGPDQARTRRQ
jgi:hypothetical protein